MSGPSSLDPLVVFEIATSGVPVTFDPAAALTPDVSAMLKADTKGFDFSEERELYNRYAEYRMLRESALEEMAAQATKRAASAGSSNSSSSTSTSTSSSAAYVSPHATSSAGSGAAYSSVAAQPSNTAAAVRPAVAATTTGISANQPPAPPPYSGPSVERVYPSYPAVPTAAVRPGGTAAAHPVASASAAAPGGARAALTPQQKITLMKDTVGERDDTICEFYLERMQWDLEGAVAMYNSMKG